MKKIMFCGGGSAGHVIPNLALCEDLNGKAELCYIGTDAIENELCKKAGIRFIEFKAVKLVRGKILCNLKIPCAMHRSISQCRKILSEEKPDLLFCKGGYVSLAPAIAAHKLNIPVITHESDLTPGLANRLIASKCESFLTTFPSTADKFANGVCTGSPMRSSLFNVNKASCKRKICPDLRPTILVFGGGSGSASINACLRSALPHITQNYNVIHLCGKGNAVDSNIRGYVQLEFADDMACIYGAADYAVSRCGSNSANELIALRIPTLFIPLCNSASRGDQVENAQYFRSLGLCRILDEDELTAENLHKEIENLTRDDKLKAALENYIPLRGNKNILKEIDRVLNR